MLNTVANSKPIRTDYRLFTSTPTRWGDADALGHINNVMLLRYIESGRLDYFERLCDISLAAGLEKGFVIAGLEVGFISQVHHSSALEVGTRVSRLRNSSFDVEASIFQPGDDSPVLTTKAVCVWMDLVNNRSQSIPDDVRQTIINFEQRDLS